MGSRKTANGNGSIRYLDLSDVNGGPRPDLDKVISGPYDYRKEESNMSNDLYRFLVLLAVLVVAVCQVALVLKAY